MNSVDAFVNVAQLDSPDRLAGWMQDDVKLWRLHVRGEQKVGEARKHQARRKLRMNVPNRLPQTTTITPIISTIKIILPLLRSYPSRLDFAVDVSVFKSRAPKSFPKYEIEYHGDCTKDNHTSSTDYHITILL
jgi:hypothetical protein